MPYTQRGMRGDIDLDGAITPKDTAALLPALMSEQTLTWEQGYAADVHTDFSLDTRDLTLLKRWLLHS